MMLRVGYWRINPNTDEAEPIAFIVYVLLLDVVRQGSKSLCFVEKRGVVLETLLDRGFWGGNSPRLPDPSRDREVLYFGRSHFNL